MFAVSRCSTLVPERARPEDRRIEAGGSGGLWSSGARWEVRLPKMFIINV